MPALGPETLVNPGPGFFVLGAKSYGRNSQFLLRNGWAQVDDVMGLLADEPAGLRALEIATRPEHPDLVEALARRWDELPAHVKTPAQMLGRRTAGCEGTHGVFPRCNLACTPCYHSRDANRVRVDGDHTVPRSTARWPTCARGAAPARTRSSSAARSRCSPPTSTRGAAGDARHGRKPMSMTHGDFDYDHLVRLVDGRAASPTCASPGTSTR